jgi:hypothetical protein
MTDGADDGPGERDAMPPILRITEFTDAACPWAGGSEPAFRLLRHALGPLAEWRRVFGILFDEDDDLAPDPDAEARWYERFIGEVATHTGSSVRAPAALADAYQLACRARRQGRGGAGPGHRAAGSATPAGGHLCHGDSR